MPGVTVATHIVLDERGRPWIEGTNTKVVEVVLDKVAHGWTAEQIQAQHPHLSLAKVYAALSYYYDHQADVDAEVEAQVRRIDAMRAAAGESPLVQKLRAAGKLP